MLCNPRHLMCCYAGWETDWWNSTSSSQQNYFPQAGKIGFQEQRWCCKECTSQHGTQTLSAEQPLDCSYRSFNIPPLTGFKTVVRPYSSKWDLMVCIPLCSEEVWILSSWSSPLNHSIKENLFQRLLFLKNKIADTTVLYEEPNRMSVF